MSGISGIARISPLHGTVPRLPSQLKASELHLTAANARRHEDAHALMAQIDLGQVTRAQGTRWSPSEPPLPGPCVIAWPFAPQAESVWNAVDVALRHDDARAGRLEIGLAGAPTAVDDQLAFDTTFEIHRPRPGRLAAKLVDRASVRIRALDRLLQPLHELMGALDTICGQATEADVIILSGGGIHVDARDRGGLVVLIPVEGQLQCDPPGPETSDTIAAGPGEAILAGPGSELRVTAANLTLSLRLFVPTLTIPELRSTTSAMARFHPMLRADLPADLDGEVDSYGGSLYGTPGAFHAEAKLALGQLPQTRTLALLRALVPARPSFGLLAAWRAMEPASLITPGEVLLRSPLTGGVMVVDRPDGGPALAAGGLVIDLHDELADHLVPHLDGRPFDPAPVIGALAHLNHDPHAPDTVVDPVQPSHGAVVSSFHRLLAHDVLEVVP